MDKNLELFLPTDIAQQLKKKQFRHGMHNIQFWIFS